MARNSSKMHKPPIQRRLHGLSATSCRRNSAASPERSDNLLNSRYLFVAVLPYSYYIYAEACDNMKTENWLNCHVHAFNYFDGVSKTAHLIQWDKNNF